MPPDNWRAGVDIGGTFTDLLLADDARGRFVVGKVLTTPENPAAGVRTVLESELAGRRLTAAQLGTVVHGTTLVTNAIVERKGTPTALLITAGFRDTLLIAREHRYDMYDVRLEKPEPLVPRRLTFGVPERVLADGTVHRPLDEAAVAGLVDDLRTRGVRAVGVCLLPSGPRAAGTRNPARALAGAAGGPFARGSWRAAGVRAGFDNRGKCLRAGDHGPLPRPARI